MGDGSQSTRGMDQGDGLVHTKALLLHVGGLPGTDQRVECFLNGSHVSCFDERPRYVGASDRSSGGELLDARRVDAIAEGAKPVDHPAPACLPGLAKSS